jgi:uncharacterized protein YcaQ
VETVELSLREARRLAVAAQQLSGPPPKRPTKALMLETIRKLGALQIDTISVVARSHHIVLWSRLGNHDPRWLEELAGPDRALFEYWAHAAAFVPIELYPCFRRAMLAYLDDSGNGWSASTREWIRENQELLDRVVAHIQEHGAVTSSSFAPPEGAQRAAAWAWYGNKPTNLALDMLWTMGVLMIAHRQKFQRVYDLAERVHPGITALPLPSEEEERRTLAAIAVRAMGLASVRWLPDYFRTNWGKRAIPNSLSTRVLNELVESGEFVRTRVAGLSDDFVTPRALLDGKHKPSRTTLLSPFDSLIWDRRRTEELFDFFLRIECYTPAPKRQYGYFSLPILYRDQLVGRLDPKAERKARVLIVKALHLEPWFVAKADERFYAELAGALRSFSAFNECDEVSVERSDPACAAERLRAALLAV